MIRLSFLMLGLGAAMLSIGCCGPMGCGVGCDDYGCNDCDGTAGRPIPYGPFDAARQFKRSLVCGGGCGEVYLGEWRSTPPDCCDPCCGNEWVGGATPCRPFCRPFRWRRGFLIRRLRNLYGIRYCTGDQSSASCGCGDVGCDGDCGAYENVVDGEFIDSYDEGVPVPTGGCATCAAKRIGNRQLTQRYRSGSHRLTAQRVSPRRSQTKNHRSRTIRR